MSLEPKDTPQGTIGAAFANALVAGKYEVAHNMLSTWLQTELSPTQLKEKFESMIAYGRSHPNSVNVMSVSDDWHSQEDFVTGDIGSAYVAISGDGFSEAVNVFVGQEQTKYVIRVIDWGRP